MTRRSINRRDLLKGAGAGALGLAAALSGETALAAGADPALEGTWTSTIRLLTGPAAPLTFHGLYTYSPGGGLVQTDQSERTPPLLGPGHGIWSRLGTGRFRYKLIKYAFDEKGNPMGSVRIKGLARVTGSNAYTSKGTYAFYDGAGRRQAGGRFSDSATRVFFQ